MSGRRISGGLAALSLLAGLLAWVALPADAQGFPEYTVDSTAACEDGARVITWIVTNLGPMEMATLTLESHTDGDVTPTSDTAFSPVPLAVDASATATTTLDGTFVGEVDAEMSFTMGLSSPFVITDEIDLTAPCPSPTTTTTAPTTTAPPAQPAAAEATQPTFTG